MARRRRSTTIGMASEQHADTKVHTIGPGTIVTANHILRDTEVGDRDPDGGDTTIQVGRGLGEECNVGDTCKYLNIFIQVGPRLEQFVANGWIEWAICMHKGTDTPPTNTNLGTLTLGTVCTNYFRNECILTGNIPVGLNQPNSATIKIKVPKFKQKLRVGDRYTLFLYARTISATETATNTFRVISSFMYKNYH